MQMYCSRCMSLSQLAIFPSRDISEFPEHLRLSCESLQTARIRVQLEAPVRKVCAVCRVSEVSAAEKCSREVQQRSAAEAASHDASGEYSRPGPVEQHADSLQSATRK